MKDNMQPTIVGTPTPIMDNSWIIYLTNPTQHPYTIATHDKRYIETTKTDSSGGVVVRLHDRGYENPECNSIMLLTTINHEYKAWYNDQFWDVGRLY